MLFRPDPGRLLNCQCILHRPDIVLLSPQSPQPGQEQLRSAPFDLIILDICLPDLTGWEVLRAAQREGCLHSQEIDGDGQKLPVVVLSAVRVSPRRLVEFQPLAYLPKPFPIDALLRLVFKTSQPETDASADDS